MPRQSKADSKERIQKLIDQIDVLASIKRGSPEFTKWRRDTRVALENVFSDIPERVQEFTEVSYHPGLATSSTSESDYQGAYIRGLRRAEAILQSMVEEIEEYWEESQAILPQQTFSPELAPVTDEVFVIHGHDHGVKNTIARFLENLGLTATILHEQPDEGRTVIEKLEHYANGFAVALLTPDDVGGTDEHNLKPRARQNVILEMGYFAGKLGRQRVRALKSEGVEVPSDFSGVLYIALDDSEMWKMSLIRELKGAGFDIDANRIFE